MSTGGFHMRYKPKQTKSMIWPKDFERLERQKVRWDIKQKRKQLDKVIDELALDIFVEEQEAIPLLLRWSMGYLKPSYKKDRLQQIKDELERVHESKNNS